MVRVWRLDGQEEWLLIHLEIQARKEAGFPFRMLTYSIRILDRFGRLATSLAILTDTSPTWRPTHQELTAPLTSLTFDFAITKLLDYKPQETQLQQSTNPFAWITLAHLKTQSTRRSPTQRKTWKFAIMRQLYIMGMPGPEIRNLYKFIDWTMILPDDLEAEFWQELKTFEEEQKVTYVTNAERFGRKDGAAENSRDIALRMLKKGMDLETIAELTQLSPAQLQQLQTQLPQT